MSTPSAFHGSLDALVHAGVTDPVERAHHVGFIGSRFAVGIGALAGLPVQLALTGVLTAGQWLMFLGLGSMLLAGAATARTASLDLGCAISALCVAAFAAGLWMAGIAGTPVVLSCLLLTQVDALVFMRPRAVLVAGVISALAGACILTVLPSHGGAQATAGAASMALLSFLAINTLACLGIYWAARRLLEEERRNRFRLACDNLTVDAIGDLVTFHDASGAIIRASRSSRALTGLAPHALEGQGLFAQVHVADRPLYLKALSDAMHGRSYGSSSFRVRRHDSEHADGADGFIWVEMRTRDLSEIDGEERSLPGARVVAILRDVTTWRMHEENLEAARLEAERTSLAKDRFLATVSHELRTPLNAIIGFSEILGSDQMGPIDDERRREYGGIIHSSGQHLLEVVNALLDMSKIESGKFDLVLEPFSAESVIRSACDMMGLKAAQAEIALACQIEEDLPEIVSDRRACRQITLNLVSNAVKFTPAGGVVKVKAGRKGDALVVTVEDSGIGIASDDLGRVGEPFVQVHATYDRPYEGTGLGLSVVRGLVGLLGGTILIESAPAQGTIVSVRLPLASQPPQQKIGPAPIVTRQRAAAEAASIHSLLQAPVRKSA